jgi:hypothetical protein
MSCRFRLVLGVLGLLVATPAAAATLTTSFFLINATDEVLDCRVLNAGTKTVEIAVRVVEVGEDVLADDVGEVLAGSGRQASINPDEDVFAYCEFEVSGSTKGIRAVGVQLQSGQENMVLPAQ